MANGEKKRGSASKDGMIRSERLRKMLGGITETTLQKWLDARIFPAPIVVRGRNYWFLLETIEWLRNQPRRVPAGKKA